MIPVIIYLVGIVVAVIVLCILFKIHRRRVNDDAAISCAVISGLWPLSLICAMLMLLWYMYKRAFYSMMSLCDIFVNHFRQ